MVQRRSEVHQTSGLQSNMSDRKEKTTTDQTLHTNSNSVRELDIHPIISAEDVPADEDPILSMFDRENRLTLARYLSIASQHCHFGLNGIVIRHAQCMCRDRIYATAFRAR